MGRFGASAAIVVATCALLAGCGSSSDPVQPLVPSGAVTSTPASPSAASPAPSKTAKPSATPTKKPSASPKPTKKATPAVDKNYGTCADAVAAGKGPYYKGKDPEYDYYEDRDGDGVVCES